MPTRLDKLDVILLCLLIALSTLILYPSLSTPFIILDDPFYVTANLPIQQGLSLQSISWAFQTFYYGNWAPLTWLYHMLDYELFALNPWGHHLTSLILHIASSVLFYLLLKRFGLSLAQSFLAAAIFAIHPLHVEPVVWVASHKDILSGFFFFVTLHLYLNYVRADSKKRPQNIVALHFAFLLGLMAKSVLVTLPVLLLLLDYWPLQRRESKAKLILEKLPLFALSFIFIKLTKYGQGILGATSYDFLSFPRRLGNACYYLARYLYNFIWPFDLAIQYPHPFSTLPKQFLILCAGIICLLSLYSLSQVRKRPAIFLSWAWFLLLLLPYLQIAQVGNQAMSDRWMYLPLAGLAIFAVCIFERFLFSLLALVLFFAILSYNQLSYWKEPGGIFIKSLEVAIDNDLAYLYLGLTGEEDRQAEVMSLSYYKRALGINPNNEIAFQNVAYRLRKIEKDKHLFLYVKHLGIFKEGLASSHIKRGKILKIFAEYDSAVELFKRRFKTSPYELAVKHFEQALKTYPDHGFVHIDLAQVLLKLGDKKKAEQHFAFAEKYSPRAVPVLNAFGLYYLKQGKNDLARSKFLLGLETNPNSTELRVNLGNAYLAKGQLAEAKEQYLLAIKLVELKKEKNIIPYLGIADIYARESNNLRAFNYLAYAFDLEPKDPEVLNRLAGIHYNSKEYLEALNLLNYAVSSEYIFKRASKDLKVSMLFNRSLAFRSLGELHRARESLQWLLVIDSTNAPARNLLEDIEREIVVEQSEK